MAVSAAAARPSLARNRPGELADPFPWAAAAAYACIYFALGDVRYAAHRNFVDLGIFAQTAASAFGCFCNTVEGSHWAVHFSPILYVAGALMRVWPSALSLIALAAIAGALTIPPVYALVYRYADRRAARLAALVVFVYPPLAGVVFNDFHENVFAPAAVAWLLWAFDGGKLWAMMAFAAVTLSIKEDQALFLAIAGVLAFLRYRGTWPRGPAAAAIAGVAAALLYKFFFQIEPAAAHHTQWSPSRFYSWHPADAAALLPWGILQRLGFLLLAFLPLLFLPFFTRTALLLAAPLAEVLLSRDSTTFTVGSHYAGAWCGYALYAFTAALRPKFARSPARAYRMLIACAVLCALEFAIANPLHPGYFLHAPQTRDARLDRFLRTLPPRVSIATQEEAFTHLAATDPNAAVLPETAAQPIAACAILIDEDFPESPRLQEAGARIRELVSSGVYRQTQRDGGIILYTKPTPCR
ncbi:MAG TPA: DUF2079 domain-containing protein [Candidatus Baltobacteraceae bacterium]|nr:DUF2079 domain-containing protein [Candidatus Baltobacteraceae bacterium]